MTPRQLGSEIEVAYHGRAEDSHRRFLGELIARAGAALPPLSTLTTREQLEERRNELHVQLAAVNDRLMRIRQAGQLSHHLERAEWLKASEGKGSLDPSDPAS